MEISYISHSCFKIKSKALDLVIDPYEPKQTGYKLPKLTADVVLTSHDHFDHNYIEGVSEFKHKITGPGEYEINDVFIRGLPSFHDANQGADRGKNTMYVIDVEGFALMHLGDLGHELQKETLEMIPDIDVLFIPVGGHYTIDAKTAVKVISSIEPGIVVPMHYKVNQGVTVTEELSTLQDFLSQMGAEKPQTVEKLKISSRNDVPGETTVIVISPQI